MGKDPSGPLHRQFRQVGVALTIPFLMVAAPGVGLVLGLWLDGLLGTSPWLKVIGVLLGLIAGGRETYLIVRRLSREMDDDGSR